jgi:TolB-like protein/Tfp pilus assembly protein PilF
LVATFAELRRRRVFRVAAAYVVLVWALLQVADVVFPALGFGNIHIRALLIVSLLGFPLAVFLTWRYDLTTEGLVRTRPARDGELTLKRADYAVLTLLFLVATLAGYGIVTTVVTDENVAALAPLPVSEAPIIAVLPLANMSGNPGNEYFADGLTEELLNVLAKVDGLKVIGRTSSFAFKDRNEDLTEIGKALRATHLLEGSVRQSGDTIRVTAQLIEVEGATHLWSDQFDRPVGDLFAIQTSIATAVVEQLKIPLLEADAIRVNRARNFRAFDRYLAGKSNVRLRSLEGTRMGVALFKEAIALDDEFSPAYANLALAFLRLHVNYGEMDFDDAFGQAEAAIQSALSMDPESAEAYAALAVLRQWTWQLAGRDDVNRSAADQAYRDALRMNPNDPDTNRFYANFLTNTGQKYAAIEYARRAVEIDPIAPNGNSFLGAMHEQLGEFDEAKRLYLQETRVNPEGPRGYEQMASLSARAFGDLAEAGSWLIKAIDIPHESAKGTLARLYLDLGRHTEALALIEQIRNESLEARWLDKLFAEDYETAYQILATRLHRKASPVRNDYRYAGRAACLAGDHAVAADLLGTSDQRLLSDEIGINPSSVLDAVCLARSLQALDRTDRATQIFNALLNYFAESPRLGSQGYGFADTHVYLLMGQKDDALNAFETAVQQGVRTTWFSDRWPRPNKDPILAPLRASERFQTALDALEADLEAQAAERLENDAQAVRRETREDLQNAS